MSGIPNYDSLKQCHLRGEDDWSKDQNVQTEINNLEMARNHVAYDNHVRNTLIEVPMHTRQFTG